MLRWAGQMGCMAMLAVATVSGCKENTRVMVIQQAPPPAVAVEPAPVVEAPVAAPVAVAAAPVVVAPAPVVVEPVVTPAVSVGFFVERLGHHGRWTTVATYGRVWVPSGVAVGWQPYSMGHWVYTEAYGWTWVSDEPWGWATYHYGRWVYLEPQGWAWVPGTVWAPAWVVWRTGGGYVGWAPMPPEAVVAPVGVSAAEVNINININIEQRIHHDHWVFVEERHILEPVHTHIVLSTRSDWIMNVTRPSTHIVEVQGRIVNRSLAVRDVERASGQQVRAMRVREVDAGQTRDSGTVVRGDEVVMPRPRLRPIADTRTTSTAGTTDRSATAGRGVDSAAQPASPLRSASARNVGVTAAPASPATGAPVTRLPAGTAPRTSTVSNGAIQTTDIRPGGSASTDTTRQAKGTASRTDAVKGDRVGKPVTDTPAAPVASAARVPVEGRSRLDANTVAVDRSAHTVRAAAAVKSPTAVSQAPLAANTANPAGVRHVDTTRDGVAVSKGPDVSRDRAIASRGKLESAPTGTVEQPKVNAPGNERVSSVRRGGESTPKDAAAGDAGVRKASGSDVRRDRSRTATEKENDREAAKD